MLDEQSGSVAEGDNASVCITVTSTAGSLGCDLDIALRALAGDAGQL